MLGAHTHMFQSVYMCACDCDNHYTAVHSLWKYWACRPHINPSNTQIGIVIIIDERIYRQSEKIVRTIRSDCIVHVEFPNPKKKEEQRTRELQK